jgi:hypothetical protein
MDNTSRRLYPARAAIAGLALAALPMSSFAFVSVGVSITVAPPALPVYVQPPCPAVGYIWTPGYWAYNDDDYYWVPGTWVMAPQPGYLWTPGYWGWGSGLYLWHEGYWGPHVGFYGGVNYGYGYGGVGFEGGYWRGNAFYYNRSVANLGGVHVTNVYNKTVINNYNVTRVSFNGGEGGLRARPNPHELSAARDHHVAFTSMQRNQEHAAFGNHDLRASVNQGKPRIAATQRPGLFTGHGVETARAGEWHGGSEHGVTGHGPEGRPGNDHGAPGRGPDVHADRGGPAHGGPEHVASHNDRPPGASGSAEVRGGAGGGRGPESHGGPSGEPAHTAGRNDRPSGGNLRGGATGGGEPAARVPGRSDRPPSVGGEARGAPSGGGQPNSFAGGHNERPPGAGSPEVRGGAGGGHTEQPHVNMSHNDRPSQPNGGGAAPRASQPREMHNTAPAPRPSAPQPSARQFNGGGGGQPAARPQMAPRPEAAPHQQSAPRPEAHRGGGEPPHGQGGSGRPQPQGRGGNEHGRR